MCVDDAMAIVGEVYDFCEKLFPNSIHDAFLYGSYARGDYDSESDVNILLTVDLDGAELPRYRKAIASVTSDLSLKYDVMVSVTVKPLDQFQRFSDVLPFYKNVLSEGIRYGLPDVSKITAEQLDAELEKGYADVLAGRCKPAQEVFEELRKEFDL